MDKSFRLAEKAGHLLGECLGGAVVTTSYSQDHNDLIWELSGYQYLLCPRRGCQVLPHGAGPGAAVPRQSRQAPGSPSYLQRQRAPLLERGNSCQRRGFPRHSHRNIDPLQRYLQERQLWPVCLRFAGCRSGCNLPLGYADEACLRSFPPSSYSKGPR